MLQKQRQKQNDDSVNNNNDIDVIMMNHTLSKNPNRTKSHEA